LANFSPPLAPPPHKEEKLVKFKLEINENFKNSPNIFVVERKKLVGKENTG